MNTAEQVLADWAAVQDDETLRAETSAARQAVENAQGWPARQEPAKASLRILERELSRRRDAWAARYFAAR